MKSFNGKTVLIAGGTRGIGLASGIEFAKLGARVWLTHRWGSVSEHEVEEKFQQAGAIEKPRIIQADITVDEDTKALLQTMKSEGVEEVEVFLASASSLLRIQSLQSYKKRSFLKTLEYAAWPIASYPLEMKETFGRYPRYILGISTFSTLAFHSHYDFAAAGKSAMETLIKYMAVRLRPYGSTINILRPPAVETEALEAVFGKEKSELLKKIAPSSGFIMSPEDVAQSVVGLCSGYFDKVSGQIISLDEGAGFMDTSLGILERDDLREVLSQHFGISK